MTVVSAGAARESRLASCARAVRRERTLVVLAVIWVLFLANFTALGFGSGDAIVQFQFVQRLFGDASHADGYYFGLGLVEAPFYALAKLFAFLGLEQIQGVGVETVVVSLGMGLLVLPGVALLVWLLRALRLPSGATVLVGAVFGTPLFYYAAFAPGKNHLADALLFEAALALLFLYFQKGGPDLRLAAGIGALFGFAMTVRYFAGAEIVPVIVALLALRRWRDSAVVATVSAATFGLLALIPTAFGVAIFSGGTTPGNQLVLVAPLNPLRMLFTDHRGYFVWSPIAIVAAFGLVHVIRSRPQQRLFLVVAIAMGLSIAAAYTFIPYWDGTFSFSQRFLTPLFALVAIGLAGAVEARRRLVAVLTVVCVAWSLFLCFNLQTISGWMFFNRRDNGATSLAGLPRHEHYSVGAYTWGIYNQSRLVRSWLPWPGSRPAAR